MHSSTSNYEANPFLTEDESRIAAFWSCPDAAYFPPVVVIAVLGIANSTLLNWRSQGSGPVYRKAGKLIYYRKSDIIAWIEHFDVSNLVEIFEKAEEDELKADDHGRLPNHHRR